MSEHLERTVEVDVTDEQVREMVAAGFWEVADGGVLELTADGSAWVGAWCKKRLAEAAT